MHGIQARSIVFEIGGGTLKKNDKHKKEENFKIMNNS